MITIPIFASLNEVDEKVMFYAILQIKIIEDALIMRRKKLDRVITATLPYLVFIQLKLLHGKSRILMI